jgi:hypothetical protein
MSRNIVKHALALAVFAASTSFAFSQSVFLTANVSDFDYLLQLMPTGRALLYRSL